MRDMRGRSRNSSPSTSCQSASTSAAFVKKRWPPRSNRYPSISTVFASPPTWSSASRIVTGRPALPSRYPAVSPAGPAPTTSVCVVESSICAGATLPAQHVNVGLHGLREPLLERELVGLEVGDAPQARVGAEQSLPLPRALVDELRPLGAPATVVAEDRPHDDQPAAGGDAGDHSVQGRTRRRRLQPLDR